MNYMLLLLEFKNITSFWVPTSNLQPLNRIYKKLPLYSQFISHGILL